jgi:hypothetical protein
MTAAQHHVFDQRGVEVVARLELMHQGGEELDRLDFVQRTAGLAAAARCANGIEDEGLGHDGAPG